MENKEKVVLVAVQTANEQDETFKHILNEMQQLVTTAQGQVVAEFIQKREKIHGTHLVGKGKLEEINNYIIENEIDLVVTYQSLSGSMQRNLQETLQVRVIDRVQLILDIFALRARSKEGKLQVQLAQLNYLLPRLSGQVSGFSRLGGGIGTRGPGETKLEVDKRHLRQQINVIETQLHEVAEHRKRSRSQRQNRTTIQIGLIGYTNAGKSSILNRLADVTTYEQDELFATLDPLTRKIAILEPFDVTLTDTVGFIQEIPTTLIHAFKSTLEESREVDLLVHVVDASSPFSHQHEKTVLKLITELKMNHIPRLTVYNKMDLVSGTFQPTEQPYMTVSTRSQADMEQLKLTLAQQIKKLLLPFRIEVSAFDQRKLVEIQQQSVIESFNYDQEKNLYTICGYSKRNWDAKKGG